MKKLLSLVSVAALVVTIFALSVKPTSAAASTFSRLEGADRFLTAVAVSQKSFPTDHSVQNVYLYNSDSPIDALAAAPLASSSSTAFGPADGSYTYRGPLLPIKGGTEVTAEVAAEIDRVFSTFYVDHVVILGGTTAISQSVEDQFVAQGRDIDRLSGKDRFETSAAIAKVVRDTLYPNVPDLFIVNGYSMADALAIGPWAANFNYSYGGLSDAGGVILLSYKDMVPQETIDFVDGQAGGFITLVGGSAVVDASVGEMLSQRHWGNSSTYGRYAGNNRYETARAIANAFIINGGPLTDFAVGLANGRTMVDALPAGPFLGSIPAPLLLTDGENLNCQAAEYIEEWQTQIKDGYVFGGTAAVSQTGEDQAEAITKGLTSASNIGC
jgi:hypothetical protein